MKQITVVMGGTSSERNVSLLSGETIAGALEAAGFSVTRVTLDVDAVDTLPTCDAVFLALHGGYGENGGIQADLDARHISYTGPGAAASRICMDKLATHRVLAAAGIPMAPYAVVHDAENVAPLPLPVVVKPPRDGSSVGISKVTTPDQWPTARDAAQKADPHGEALVETFIPGREWTVSVLGGEALPVIEIRPASGWYGYEEKYLTDTTNYVFPDAAVDGDVMAACQRLAVAAFHATGCRGAARVDFRVTPAGEPYVLELNTLPGFTAHSLLPKAAQHAGIDLPTLCTRLLTYATHD